VILPAIEAGRARSIDCSGPHAADTIFRLAVRGGYDLVVAMYHDQGHIAMKLIDFEGTVNISLGIPIIRTSVDQGTAFDIAGKNRADSRGMKQAMRLAAHMATTRRALAGSLRTAPICRQAGRTRWRLREWLRCGCGS
jgi:4-hydroxythreonine-4-phosphate dehydrogenase